jgi:hypothetical protein
MGFLLPVGGADTNPPWLAYNPVKFLAIAAAAALLALNLAGPQPKHRLIPGVRSVVWPLVAYSVVLGAATVS